MFSHKETSYRLYSILGISKSASREEIRKSYIKLARKDIQIREGMRNILKI